MKVPTEAEMQAMRDRLEIRGSSLWWKAQPSGNVDMTKPAGTPNPKGYLRVAITADTGKRWWFSHRIAYFLYHSVWPTQILDHEDRDKLNNNPKNLRPATQALNTQNSKAYSTNKLGTKGVCKNGRLYCAYLHIEGERHSKLFPTIQEAIAHRKYLEEKFHPFAPSQQNVI